MTGLLQEDLRTQHWDCTESYLGLSRSKPRWPPLTSYALWTGLKSAKRLYFLRQKPAIPLKPQRVQCTFLCEGAFNYKIIFGQMSLANIFFPC